MTIKQTLPGLILIALLAAAPAMGAMQGGGMPTKPAMLSEPAAYGSALCTALADDPGAFGARADKAFMQHVVLRMTTDDAGLKAMKDKGQTFDSLVAQKLADPQEMDDMNAAMERVGADIAACRVLNAKTMDCADLYAVMADAGFMGKAGVPESVFVESGGAAHLKQCGLLELDNDEGEHGYIAIAASDNTWQTISAWRDDEDKAAAPVSGVPVTRLENFGPTFCSAVKTNPNAFGKFLAIRPLMRIGLELEFSKDEELKKQMDEMGMDVEKMVDLGIKESGLETMEFPMMKDLGACEVTETRILACEDLARILLEDGMMGEDPIPMDVTRTVLDAYEITECGSVILQGDDGQITLGLVNMNGAWLMITIWE